MKKVYVGMSVDIIHHGHLNIINEAKKLGKDDIGLLTVEVIASNKSLQLIRYDKRNN